MSIEEPHQLKRSIHLPFLILYGLGTMVGGGFYALLGKVAGEAGMHAPIAFGLSGLLAVISAFSFAELSARYPVSAGEARYAQEGFNSTRLAQVVGWLVVVTGIVSAAALSVATIGFVQDFVAVPELPCIALLVLLLGGIAAWGITESVAVVTVITIIEIGALLFALVLTGDSLGDLPSRWNEILIPKSGELWLGIFAGGFLAFYAFIGFEDMVNMAEEVHDAPRALPIGILVCVAVTAVLYVLVATVAVLAVPPAQLEASNTPLAELVRGHGWFSTTGLGLVSILTGLNGALVQIIMAARVIYGMSKRDQAPRIFARVHPRRQTPLQATALITAVILVLALFFPLVTLAKGTSTIILLIFAIVNLALWRIKGRDQAPAEGHIRFPRWLPLLGFLTCTAVLLFQVWQVLAG